MLKQYKLDDNASGKRLAELVDRMAKADGNRDRLLKLTAESCRRKVEEAKIRARKVKKERDEVARNAEKEMLEKMENAEKRRVELLSARGRRGSPVRRATISDEERVTAATKIQRVWRRKRLIEAVHQFNGLEITMEKVTTMSFEEVVSKFRAASTIRVASRLLTVLGILKQESSEKEIDGLVRTFLSAFMIIGHTIEVFHSHGQPLETVSYVSSSSNIFQDLLQKARLFVENLDSHNHTLTPNPRLKSLWDSYLAAFTTWKSHDSSILVEMLVTKFVELDSMLLDIQESAAMQSVVEEYAQAIKSGQMLLLSKIRRLVGNDTRNTVKRAVQAGRRRRAQALQRSPVEETTSPNQSVTEVEQQEIVEPPNQSVLSNRRIMHELALNPNYEISPPEKSEDQLAREETIKNAFYDTLSTSLREGTQALIPSIVADIKTRLLALLTPSTPSYTQLSEHLDSQIVEQQCHRNLFDLTNFLNYVQNMMRQLCAPIRDQDVSSISTIISDDEIDTFIARLKRIQQVLGQMALDSANFHFNIARPALVQQAIQYERTKFAEEIANGAITLEKTRQWIKEAGDRLLEDHRDGEAKPTTLQIWRHAFAEILLSDKPSLPETFEMDVSRITDIRRKIKLAITLSSLILVTKTFTAGTTSRQLDFSTLSQRLRLLVEEETEAENVLVEIERWIGQTHVKRDLLLSMIRRVQSDSRDPCVSLLQRRVRSLIGLVLAGGEVTGLAGMGLGEVAEELGTVMKSAKGLGRVNWECYKEWYMAIGKEYLDG